MKITNRRTNVIDVTFIPEGWSEPETHTHPREELNEDEDNMVADLLDHYESKGEVLGIWYRSHPNEHFPSGRQLYGNKRYE